MAFTQMVQYLWQTKGSRFGLMLLLWSSLSAIQAPASLGQQNLTHLNQDLDQAVAAQQWDRAIQVIEKMMVLSPSQHSRLEAYRNQLIHLKKKHHSSGHSPRPLQTAYPKGQVPIKRRDNGVIIINAKFNNRQNFDMLLDSGASMTVITRPMASTLGIKAENVVSTAVFTTANGTTEMPIVYVRSIEVGGLTTQQVPVAVAGPDMEIGLLGQDFLQHYDVSIKRDRVEFHYRNE